MTDQDKKMKPDEKSVQSDRLEIINKIIGAAEAIRQDVLLPDENAKYLIDKIYNEAWKLREKELGGTIKERLQNLPEGYEYIPVNQFVEKASRDLFGDKKNVDWVYDNQYQGDYYALPGLFGYLVESLINCALKQGNDMIRLEIKGDSDIEIILRAEQLGEEDIIMAIIKGMKGEYSKGEGFIHLSLPNIS